MEQADGATEANQRDEILRSFSAGGAYSKRRDLWLLVSARNSETRSRLRNDGILHLADVLQRDDFDAVECLAKVWSRSKVERESSSKALGVTAFKANAQKALADWGAASNLFYTMGDTRLLSSLPWRKAFSDYIFNRNNKEKKETNHHAAGPGGSEGRRVGILEIP